MTIFDLISILLSAVTCSSLIVWAYARKHHKLQLQEASFLTCLLCGTGFILSEILTQLQ